jgi:hypothetical protein
MISLDALVAPSKAPEMIAGESFEAIRSMVPDRHGLTLESLIGGSGPPRGQRKGRGLLGVLSLVIHGY